MRILLLAAALVAVAACEKPSNQNSNGSAAAVPAETVKGVHRDHKGGAAPAAPFNDPDGEETSIADFKGKPTLVNLWATWCAPCVKELPTLDRLARERDGKLNVVAVSQDMGPQASVEAFLKTQKIAVLEAYHDPKMALSGALGPDAVLPTSILYDADGKEVWRYVGELDWTSAGAAKLLSEAGAAPKSR